MNRWLAAALAGSLLVCGACVTSVTALVLGSIGIAAAWAGRVELAVLVLAVAAVVVGVRRLRCRRPVSRESAPRSG